MAGIIGYGAYVPRNRIKVEEIAKVWGADAPTYKRGLGLEQKSVPTPDQDTITMSVEGRERYPVRVRYQRELRELWGISFPGSPRLEEDFCLEGWDDIPPMRREFNTVEFCERTFVSRDGRATVNPREHMHEVIFPERGGDRS